MIDCRTFLTNITNVTMLENCEMDMEFNYTFTNVGQSCVSIEAIRAEVLPLGSQGLNLNDVYNYKEREICYGDSLTVPDRRFSVNLCEELEYIDPWEILLYVDEFNSRTKNLTFEYEWEFSPTSSPQPSFTASIEPSMYQSIHPSNEPSIQTTPEPSAKPSQYNCQDCTLTGLISGSKIQI